MIGPSSGIDAADDRVDFKVGAEDLREMREAAELRVDTRPGMMLAMALSNAYLYTIYSGSCLKLLELLVNV